MAERKALGRGLGALLGEAAAAPRETGAALEKIYLVPRKEIRPDPEQPRREMDEAGLRSLAASIKVHGVLQPLLLKAAEEGYQIVAGERRWRAAGLADLENLPARIINPTENDAREISLIENVQRKDLTPIEVASALEAMIERSGLTQEECASRLGWSRATVTNRLRLLRLPDEVRAMLADESLTEGHGRALLPLADSPETLLLLARRAADGSMTVRQLEEAVRSAETAPSGQGTPLPLPRGRFQTLRLTRPLRDFRRRGIKIRVGRRGGAARIVLDDLKDVDDELLLQALEECLNRLYPEPERTSSDGIL